MFDSGLNTLLLNNLNNFIIYLLWTINDKQFKEYFKSKLI